MSNPTQPGRRALTGAAALAALLGAAPAPAQKQPIVIGSALALTGNLADSGEHVRKAYLLWAEEINARGGLIGRQVEIKIYDDRSDGATAARLYERLITQDKVDLLLGPFGSASTATATAIAEKHKRVFLNVAGASQSIHRRGFKYIFQVLPPIVEYVAGVAPLMQERGYKSMMIVTRDYAASRDIVDYYKANAARLGIDLKSVDLYPAGASDYSNYISKAKAQNVDVWLSIAYPNESVEMVKQFKAAGYAPKMFASQGVSQEDFIQALGKDAEFALGMSPYEHTLPTRGNKDFTRSWVLKYKYLPGYYAGFGYGACKVLEEAVKKVGSLDQEKLRNMLSTMETETPLGPYKVDRETGEQIGTKAVIVEILGGKREVVWPAKLSTAKPVLPYPQWDKR